MNINVGDMPLEIFGDYVSDFLGIDYSWEYLVPMLNGRPPASDFGDGLDMNEETLGDGDYYEYITIFWGNGKGSGGNYGGNNLHGFASGDGCSDNINSGNGCNDDEYIDNN